MTGPFEPSTGGSHEPGSYEMDFGDQGLTGAERDRLVSGQAEMAERDDEAALRPKGLADFIGQPQVREQLSLVLDAAKARQKAPDHVLLSGPPGLGKTTLAMIIAHEMGSSLRVTSGPAVQHAGDLAAILSSLEEGEVLFIDEIHRMARAAEEMLYVAMEDFRVDVIVGKGPGATAIPLDLPQFTLVGATTDPVCSRRRCGTASASPPCSTSTRARTCSPCSNARPGCSASTRSRPDSRRSRPAPAAPRAWRTDCCAGSVTGPRSGAAASSTSKPPSTLWKSTKSMRSASIGSTDPCSTCCASASAGGPVGLGTLAVSVGEEADTVETVSEPYLVREGLISRTPRGRVATSAAWKHLEMQIPANYEF
jgi:Holliday junction DNA helicase RuvB